MTLAVDLARRKPAVIPYIKTAIDEDPYIAQSSAEDQFKKLIKQPLRHTLTPESAPLVFVIDALDECDKDEDIRLLVNLLADTKKELPSRLKIFITSRPERPVRLGFQQAKGLYQNLVLHEIPPSIIERDIATFFRYELSKIRLDFNEDATQSSPLSKDWPGEETIDRLAKMAVPLFIFAATLCRSLADPRIGHPDQQLQTVLEFQGRSDTNQLSVTYEPILDRLVDGLSRKLQEETIKRFQHIVGSIVLLGNPLPISTLGRLLEVDNEEIDTHLGLLHSVLSIPSSEESPVRIFHLSFHDFLVDSEYQGRRFWIDKEKAHSRLATHCLRIMNKSLHINICEAMQPGTDRTSIDTQTISNNILPEVQYACVYWVDHIQNSGSFDQEAIHKFLLDHFLHWLEVLCFIGRSTEGLSVLKMLQKCIEV